MQPQKQQNSKTKSGLKKKVKNKNWGIISVKQQIDEAKKMVLQKNGIINHQMEEKKYKNLTQLSLSYSFNPQAVIGNGFASTVYLGTKNGTNQMLCVKVVDAFKLGRQAHLIHKEIQFLFKFGSDYIIKLYDVFQSNTFFYLVMELCPGGDLYKMLKKSPINLPTKFINTLIKQIARGLKQIHDKNTIHRDMKTQNIFIVRFPQGQNQQIKIKIGDLGFCVDVMQLQETRRSGKTPQNVGSPIYMSTEVSKDLNYSFSSDIYALGIIWFQLYHKRAPWQAKSQEQLLHKKLNTPPEIWREDIQQNIKQMIQRCISNQPQKRPSCQEILSLIQQNKMEKEEHS